jgi:hypothetical protein
MATAMRLADDKEGKGEGCKGNGNAMRVAGDKEGGGNKAEVRSSRRADRGLKYILKVRYRCWVHPNKYKELKVMLRFCFLSD